MRKDDLRKKNMFRPQKKSEFGKWARRAKVVVRVTRGTGTGGSPYWVGQDGTGTGGSSAQVGQVGTVHRSLSS